MPAPLETVTDFCGVPFETILVLVTYLLPVGLVIEVTGRILCEKKNAKERNDEDDEYRMLSTIN